MAVQVHQVINGRRKSMVHGQIWQMAVVYLVPLPITCRFRPAVTAIAAVIVASFLPVKDARPSLMLMTQMVMVYMCSHSMEVIPVETGPLMISPGLQEQQEPLLFT